MIVKITEFLSALETVVPLSQAGYGKDAIGLQAGLPHNTQLTAALFSYEVTEEVIREAKERGTNLIVAFHPLIFPSIDSITDATRTGDLLRQLIRNDIALYVQHTAFDTHPEFGTSRLMAEELQLQEIQVLLPLPQKPEAGMGVIGVADPPISIEELLERMQTVFGTPSLRYSSINVERISKIAMVGGAGMEFYSAAVKSGAEAFITADVRYHDFYRAAHDGILLIDAGHAETERFVTRGMTKAAVKALNLYMGSQKAVILQDELSSLLLTSSHEPNAVHYRLEPKP